MPEVNTQEYEVCKSILSSDDVIDLPINPRIDQKGREIMSEIIWQSVLDQLRMTMPHSAFDTWVANTHFVSSNETLFLVGCRNTGTRDWLENRVQTSVEHLLTGMLNRPVTVSFVVADGSVSESSDERELAEDEVQVEAVWDSVYEQVVRPEKAIALNAYFLRYLRLLGPELGWLYVGFRQAAYSAGGRSGRRTARFTGKVVATLSGMSERTFWRKVGSQETWPKLAGLVNLVGEKPLWNEKSATPRRLPRKYSVAMTLPLTATDARSLMHWIAAHMEDAGGPVGVLELACKTPVEEIIPVNAASVTDREPLPVGQLVRELFSEDIPEAELKALAERLRMHLMPSGNLVMISLFFVEHVLPHLGAGPGWMLTILRDRCWVNPENGETRNRVTVKGGYAEIAGWMGLERAMTVYEWLHGKHRPWLPVNGDGEKTKKPNPKAGQYLNPALRVYVREVEREDGVDDFAEGSREFEALLDEIPAEIMAAIVAGDPSLIYATGSVGFTRLSQDVYAIDSIAFTQLSQVVYAIDSIAFTRLSQELYAIGRVFKLLSSKPALKTLLKPTTTGKSEKIETPSPTQKPVVVGKNLSSNSKPETAKPVDEKWDLNSILGSCGVSAKKRRELLASQVNPNAFVSWIIYGFSNRAQGLNDPVGNAIQNVLAGGAGAGGVCDRLAAYGSEKLIKLLTENLHNPASSSERAFAGFSYENKQELYLRLGGIAEDMPARKPAPLPAPLSTTVSPIAAIPSQPPPELEARAREIFRRSQ